MTKTPSLWRTAAAGRHLEGAPLSAAGSVTSWQTSGWLTACASLPRSTFLAAAAVKQDDPDLRRRPHVSCPALDERDFAAAAEFYSRLAAQGEAIEPEPGAVCCYVRQDKIRAYDPDGVVWEYYSVLEHIETP